MRPYTGWEGAALCVMGRGLHRYPLTRSDKGRRGADVGALRLSLEPHKESRCARDKRKAPSHPLIHPLSLRVRGDIDHEWYWPCACRSCQADPSNTYSQKWEGTALVRPRTLWHHTPCVGPTQRYL